MNFLDKKSESSLCLIGLQWGDEGKGKLIDSLAKNYDFVIRFNGGHNAGHTIFPNKSKSYKLRIIPSGILHQGLPCIISSEVVIEPYTLLKEISMLQNSGVEINREKLIISSNCHIVLDLHVELDKLYESLRGDEKIGTTQSGIGPCYEDKIGRRGIRLADLFSNDYSSLRKKIKVLIKHHNLIRKGAGIKTLDPDDYEKSLIQISSQLFPYVYTENQISQKTCNKKILFEGAQGILLDIDHGTYPFVTSSSTIPRMNPILHSSNLVLGAIKSYCTRVGEGPMVTEILDEKIKNHLSKKGNEIGTVSNRARRCGWFDVVAAKYSIQKSGTKYLAITKLDVLSGLNKILICTKYSLNNKQTAYFPQINQEKIIPEYEVLPGWEEEIDSTSVHELPKNALAYLLRLQQLLQTPIAMISNGPTRDDIIYL